MKKPECQHSYASLLVTILSLALLFITGGQEVSAQQARAAVPSPGTKRMVELLADIYRRQDFRTDPGKDEERAEYYRDGLRGQLDLRTELKARLALADALLNAGKSAEAVSELAGLRELAQKKGIILAPFFAREIQQRLAIAYLRLGEQENCLLNHGQESCIFPIRAAAQHKLKRGATGAIRELTEILRADTDDLSAAWLLNIAYMVLGQHPQAVPAKWLFPTERFASEFEIGMFRDAAPGLGLDVTGLAGGCVLEDFDGDGLLDLMISSSGPRDQLRFFHQESDSARVIFKERTSEAGLTGLTGGLNLVHADYNNDGIPDVLVLRGGWWGKHGLYPPSLLRGQVGQDGLITFADVTEEAGLLYFHPTQTAAWADYDNDGWLDLYIGHESNSTERHPSQLFHNNHDGTFVEVGQQLGLSEMGYVKGVAWGDYNNDGWPDLYVSRKGEPNKLFRNDGAITPERPRPQAWQFTDVTAQAGVAAPLHSFATWFWDYDNDGWLDLLVTGYYSDTLQDIGAFLLDRPHKAEQPRLYHNNQDGTFTEVAGQMRLNRVILPMGANYGDLDNDGWLDCYFGTGTPQFEALLPNRMFRNANGRGFQDVTTSGGFGHLQKGHAIAFGDVDNDGDQDVFEVLGGALPGDRYQSVLFANPGHGQHWMQLDLKGVRSNAAAIGARIQVQVKTPTGSRQIHRVVSSGGSFGDSPFSQHIGLGDAQAIEEVVIRWPTTGQVQSIRKLSPDQHYRLREGNREPVLLRQKPLSLSGHKNTTAEQQQHHH